jgi:hypothetical protein
LTFYLKEDGQTRTSKKRGRLVTLPYPLPPPNRALIIYVTMFKCDTHLRHMLRERVYQVYHKTDKLDLESTLCHSPKFKRIIEY